MRFLRKTDNLEKTVLVISDLHLSAGPFLKGRRNPLEDFHHDEELVEFLEYYSSGVFQNADIELVINGDFLDFLAVPFVPFFDDEFWSEEAALAKLELITKAHKEVFIAMNHFLETKNKKITYIVGNHDAELILPRVHQAFTQIIKAKTKENFNLIIDSDEYSPIKGCVIKHGHQYEKAHDFSMVNSLLCSEDGTNYFLPPWGSYYVLRVINKFKEERSHINQIRPVKSLIINGLIYDTLFTIRFMFANAFYFIMVRFLYLFKWKKSWADLWVFTMKEIQLMDDSEHITGDFFNKRPDVKGLIVGHTHEARIKDLGEGNVFINTGTWTKMFNLDFSKKQDGFRLTYAQIVVKKPKQEGTSERVYYELNEWKGNTSLPYQEYVS